MPRLPSKYLHRVRCSRRAVCRNWCWPQLWVSRIMLEVRWRTTQNWLWVYDQVTLQILRVSAPANALRPATRAAGNINTGSPTNSFADTDERLQQCCSAAAYQCIPCRSSEKVSTLTLTISVERHIAGEGQVSLRGQPMDSQAKPSANPTGTYGTRQRETLL